MSKHSLRWTVLIVANVAVVCVLGLMGSTSAQNVPPQGPFINAVEQQLEIVNQLKALNAQIKEQNTLLRSGALQVIVVDKNDKKR